MPRVVVIIIIIIGYVTSPCLRMATFRMTMFIY
jgi:hypothetical protein